MQKIDEKLRKNVEKYVKLDLKYKKKSLKIDLNFNTTDLKVQKINQKSQNNVEKEVKIDQKSLKIIEMLW